MDASWINENFIYDVCLFAWVSLVVLYKPNTPQEWSSAHQERTQAKPMASVPFTHQLRSPQKGTPNLNLVGVDPQTARNGPLKYVKDLYAFSTSNVCV